MQNYSKLPCGYIFKRCASTHIDQIYELEMEIEQENAASKKKLTKRKDIFNDGFIVLLNENNKLMGYIESILWKDHEFEKFDEIKDFGSLFTTKGDCLYVIFLAVRKEWRRNGFGTLLLKEIEKIAKLYQVDSIKLVAKDYLESFYASVGFKKLKILPKFLENKNYVSILMVKDLV